MSTENSITPQDPHQLNYELVLMVMKFHREIKWTLAEYQDKTSTAIMPIEDFQLRSTKMPITGAFLDNQSKAFVLLEGHPMNILALDPWELSDLYEKIYNINKSL